MSSRTTFIVLLTCAVKILFSLTT